MVSLFSRLFSRLPLPESLSISLEKESISSRPRQNEKGLASLPPEILLAIFQCLVPVPTTLHLTYGTGYPTAGSHNPTTFDDNDRLGPLHIYRSVSSLPQQFQSLPSSCSLEPSLLTALTLPFSTLTSDPPLFPPPRHVESEAIEGRKTLANLARTCVALLGPARTALYEVLVLGMMKKDGINIEERGKSNANGDVKRLVESIKRNWPRVETKKETTRNDQVDGIENDLGPSQAPITTQSRYELGLLSLIQVLMIDYRGREHGVESATQACTDLFKRFGEMERYGACCLQSLIVRGLTTARIPHLRSSITLTPIKSCLKTLALTGDTGLSLSLITRVLPLLNNLQSLTLMSFSVPVSHSELDHPEDSDTLRDRTVIQLNKRLPLIVTSGPNGAASTQPPARSPKPIHIEWLDGLPRYKLEKFALYGCKLSGGSILQMVGIDPERPWEDSDTSDNTFKLELKSFTYHPTYAHSLILSPSPTLSLAIFLSHPSIANSPLQNLSIGPSPHTNTPSGYLKEGVQLRDGLSFPFHYQDPIFSLRNLQTLEVYSRKLPPLLPFPPEPNDVWPPPSLPKDVSVLEMLINGDEVPQPGIQPISEPDMPSIRALRSLRLVIEKMDSNRTDWRNVQALEREIEEKAGCTTFTGTIDKRELEVIWLDTRKNFCWGGFIN